MRTLYTSLALLFTLGLAADTTLRVVPVSGNSAQFRCGDRCKFRADVPTGPLRLRIFRGSISELASTGSDARYVGSTGCVEFYSTIVRPRNPRRPANVLDLRFYFRPKWLNGKRDGHFVFIVEHDDQPDGPEVEERPPTLRLPASLVPRYFQSGVNVTVVAPTFTPVIVFDTAARNGHRGETAAMANGHSVIPARSGPPPLTAAANDCLNLEFDSGDPVLIRRADGREPSARVDPLQLADQRR
jgi:hypothetical protein